MSKPKAREFPKRTAPKFQRSKVKGRAASGKGSKGGVPQHVPTQETRAAVAAGAATFLPHELIALQLAINLSTLKRHYRLELDTAHERATATVVSRLYGHTQKHPVACFYWLGNRDPDKWKNVNKSEHKIDVDGKLGSLADLVLASYQQSPGAPPAGPPTPAPAAEAAPVPKPTKI